MLSALRTSYRLRLAAALAGFFVLPVLAFAVWSFARISNEVRDDSDLLIRQTLKDAAGALTFERPEGGRESVVELGRRLVADLWMIRAGVLLGTHAPAVVEHGLA